MYTIHHFQWIVCISISVLRLICLTCVDHIQPHATTLLKSYRQPRDTSSKDLCSVMRINLISAMACAAALYIDKES